MLHHQDPLIPSAGFVGSSNLTGAGLNIQLELNLHTTEHTSTEELTKWFEELWASPQPRSPYDVYLKVCRTMSRDVRAGLAESR